MSKYLCSTCKWFQKADPKGKGLMQYNACAGIPHFTDDVSGCAITVLVQPDLVEHCMFHTKRTEKI